MDACTTAALVPLAAVSYIVAHSQEYIADGKEYLRNVLRLQGLKSLYQLLLADPDALFLCILLLRYARLVVHVYAKYFLYKPTPIPARPKYTPKDVHVIVPTIDPGNADFERCIQSIISQGPGAVTIVTAQEPWKQGKAEEVLRKYARGHTFIQFGTVHSVITNKRAQIVTVLDALFKDSANRQANKDKILVFVDDHVWWPSRFFFASLLAPFEDPKVGLVGTNKRPERDRGRNFNESLRNLIACAYLERHNFDVVGTNAIDGGAFVISGRTCALRAAVCMSEEFRHGFTNEYFWTPWGQAGPLNPDDDNYVTRYAMKKGWKIKFQCGEDAIMQTTLGTTGGWTKFRGQLIRWARSQWRSNSCSILRDGKTTWAYHPWTAFVYYTSYMFNFAALWDPLIIYTWYRCTYNLPWYHLAAIMLASKWVKIWPFFKRNPQDIWMWPFLILFAYLHSFIKIYALLTFWDAAWGGRNLNSMQAAAKAGNTDDDDSDGSEAEFWSGENSSGSRDSSAHSCESSSSSDNSQGRKLSMLETSHVITRSDPASARSQGSAPMSISEGPTPVSPALYEFSTQHTSVSTRPRYPSIAEGLASSPLDLGPSPSYAFAKQLSDQCPTPTSKDVHTSLVSSSDRIVRTVRRAPIATPWGQVTPSNIHKKPANVKELMLDRSVSGGRSKSRSPQRPHDLPVRQRLQYSSSTVLCSAAALTPSSPSSRTDFATRRTIESSTIPSASLQQPYSRSASPSFVRSEAPTPTSSPPAINVLPTPPQSRSTRSTVAFPMGPEFATIFGSPPMSAQRSLPTPPHSHGAIFPVQNELYPSHNRTNSTTSDTTPIPVSAALPMPTTHLLPPTPHLPPTPPPPPATLLRTPPTSPNPHTRLRKSRLTVPYTRSFRRDDSCERLHPDGDNLAVNSLHDPIRRCVTPPLPDAGQPPVRGRLRF